MGDTTFAVVADPGPRAGIRPMPGLLGLVAAWSLVGLFSALQTAGWAALEGSRPELAGLVARQVPAALAWVPLTLAILVLGRRFPLDADRWKRSLPVHLAAAAGVSLVLNAALAPVLHPGLSGTALAGAAFADALRWLHVNALVYSLITAAGMAWRRRLRRPETARSDPSGGEPEAPAPPGKPPAAALVANVGGRRVLLAPEEILWIEAAGDFVRVHGPGRPRLVSARMKDVAAALDPARFFRIHRSAIVDLDRVREYRPLGHGDYEIGLEDGTRLKVSRARGREFRRRLAGRRLSRQGRRRLGSAGGDRSRPDRRHDGRRDREARRG